ncbi:hypothetical protein PIB30_067994 [Stylosanthes scabra]|uniref:PGG domain-containing protein n=1 Tax=Stylosanthes scabra TaxID=79078 RepID=A0ABU6SNR1_9FABA|nr:hypothetical protein [Stylosanthes scabra]
MANIREELYAAASIGDIDSIYNVIQQDPRILEEIEVIPFVNTPLHTSALAGHLEFCIEIMRLKPSFGSKLNEQGFSPIHIALQNKQHNVVRRLVEINKDLVRVKGREGVTPFHFVCQSGDSKESITLLIDLLQACPDCIEDVNVRNETALHISLINGNLRAFRMLLGWLKNNFLKDALRLERSILNWKDSGGNTILHIATLHDNKRAVNLLIGKVKINAKNLENQTALDIAEAHGLAMIKTTLLKAKAKRGASVDDDDSKREDKLTKSKLPLLNHLRIQISRSIWETTEEHRNTCMVVATLVLTAIYQTVLSPPGGLTQPQGGTDNNNLVNTTSSLNSTFNTTTTTGAGKSVLQGNVFFLVTFLNSIIFISGSSIILAMLPSVRVARIAAVAHLLFYISFFVSVTIIWP